MSRLWDRRRLLWALVFLTSTASVLISYYQMVGVFSRGPPSRQGSGGAAPPETIQPKESVRSTSQAPEKRTTQAERTTQDERTTQAEKTTQVERTTQAERTTPTAPPSGKADVSGRRKTLPVDDKPASDAEIEARMAARTSHVREVCAELARRRTLDNVTRPAAPEPGGIRRDSLIVVAAMNRKLIACRPYKVASSTWRRVFTTLAGDPKVRQDPRSNIRHSMSAREVQSLVRNKGFKTIMVVRHPVIRVLSAFRMFEASGWRMDSRAAKRILASEALRSATNSSRPVTWELFVDYLGGLNGAADNIHWETYQQSCHPCEVDYDYVIHMERGAEEADWVLSRLHLDHLAKFPGQPGGLTRSDDLLAQYRSRLGPDRRQHLRDRYGLDAAMFGYDLF